VAFDWQPSYLEEIPDFAPSPRDEFAFFSPAFPIEAANESTAPAELSKVDKCSS